MIAATSLFNISSKAKEEPSYYDYQSELAAVWSEHLQADKSGVLESSIAHGDGCKCCTKLPIVGGRGRL